MLAALRVPGVSVHDVIQVHRRYLVELMQQWTRLKEDEAEFDMHLRPRRRRRAVPARLGRAMARHRRGSVEARRARGSLGETGPDHPAEVGRPAMSYLELRRVSKSYGAGATEVHALSEVDLAVERGSLVAVMGPCGLGEVDAAHDRRQSRRADERRGRDQRRCAVVDVAERQGAASPSDCRLRVPGLQSPRRAHRRGERFVAARARRPLGEEGASRGYGRARRARSRGSRDSLSRRALRWRTPAGRDRAGDRRATGSCCSPTSRRARSTRRTARP